MTIDEAIAVLTILESRSQNYSTMFKKDALQLGIEALETERYNRAHPTNPRKGLLPGETKE